MRNLISGAIRIQLELLPMKVGDLNLELQDEMRVGEKKMWKS